MIIRIISAGIVTAIVILGIFIVAQPMVLKILVTIGIIVFIVFIIVAFCIGIGLSIRYLYKSINKILSDLVLKTKKRRTRNETSD